CEPERCWSLLVWTLVTREASVGGSASISCKYIRNQNQRFFCRGDQPNICVRDGVRVSSKNRINGRFSLTDKTSAGVFTVNISNLRAEDSGKYWCAEEHSGTEDEKEKKYVFKIILYDTGTSTASLLDAMGKSHFFS
uniref:Immunoglobulin V-set domain-containing protein n=1 Tax=Sinocyclocheilus anshuiensis TaxID=1608454 RepID=A0A671RF52_9TELE